MGIRPPVNRRKGSLDNNKRGEERRPCLQGDGEKGVVSLGVLRSKKGKGVELCNVWWGKLRGKGKKCGGGGLFVYVGAGGGKGT